MANNRLVINTADFRQALRNLPGELVEEAAGIVTGAAEQAKAEMTSAYPEVTGNLKGNLRLKIEKSAFGVIAVLKNTAKHAYIFENGTQVRHTALGANRGAMPPGRVFIPIAIRRRAAMTPQFIALLRRAGFTVSGEV